MKKSFIHFFTFFLCLMTLFATPFAQSADTTKVKTAAKEYADKGKALMTMINSGSVDEAKASTLVDEMVAAATTTAEEYIHFDKKSEKLLRATIDAIPKMKTSTFKEIEHNYHDGAAFDTNVTGIDLKKEENEKYTDPVHSIVHPFLTLKAIKDKNLKSAKEELSEGLEQMVKLVEQIK